MKSLDAVIRALEMCTDWEAECKNCPYHDDNEGGLECEMRNLEEVLHYLKEYRSLNIREEHLPIGTLHFRSLIPANEWDKGAESLMLVQIEADLQVKIDELLRNYEQAYGLEPVTIREALPYLKGMNYMVIQPSEEQMQMRGYKIYKKRA